MLLYLHLFSWKIRVGSFKDLISQRCLLQSTLAVLLLSTNHHQIQVFVFFLGNHIRVQSFLHSDHDLRSHGFKASFFSGVKNAPQTICLTIGYVWRSDRSRAPARRRGFGFSFFPFPPSDSISLASPGGRGGQAAAAGGAGGGWRGGGLTWIVNEWIKVRMRASVRRAPLQPFLLTLI